MNFKHLLLCIPLFFCFGLEAMLADRYQPDSLKYLVAQKIAVKHCQTLPSDLRNYVVAINNYAHQTPEQALCAIAAESSADSHVLDTFYDRWKNTQLASEKKSKKKYPELDLCDTMLDAAKNRKNMNVIEWLHQKYPAQVDYRKILQHFIEKDDPTLALGLIEKIINTSSVNSDQGRCFSCGGQFGYALSPAVEKGYFGLAELMVSKGDRLNENDPVCFECLETSAKSNFANKELLLKKIKFALDNGVAIDYPEKGTGWTLLMEACHLDNYELTKFLLDRGANRLARNQFGQTPLRLTFELGSIQLPNIDRFRVIELLLQKNAAEKISNCDQNVLSNDLLHLAIKNFVPFDTIKFFVENGAPINAIDRSTKNVLHYSYYLDKARLEYLLKKIDSSLINARDHSGETPLISWLNEVNAPDIASFKTLLDHGADVNIADAKGNRPLHFALKSSSLISSRLEFIESLLTNGADPNDPNSNQLTPLRYAIQANDLGLFKLLLKFGANRLHPNRDNHLPLPLIETLSYCSKNSQLVQFVQTLLEKDADKQLEGNNYRNALRVALEYNLPVDVIKALDEKGPGNNTLSAADQEDFLFSLPIYNSGVIEYVLSKIISKKNLNKRNYDIMMTPLVWWLFRCVNRPPNDYDPIKDQSIAKLFIDKDINVNLCDSRGTSPLHLACMLHNQGIIQLLLEKGAYIDCVNYEGKAPADYLENSEEEIAKLFKQFSKNRVPCLQRFLRFTKIGDLGILFPNVSTLMANGMMTGLAISGGVTAIYFAPQTWWNTVKQALINVKNLLAHEEQ